MIPEHFIGPHDVTQNDRKNHATSQECQIQLIEVECCRYASDITGPENNFSIFRRPVACPTHDMFWTIDGEILVGN